MDENNNPDEELRKALHKLDEYTQESTKEPSRFEKAVEVFQSLFSREYQHKKDLYYSQVKKDLIKSIGYIKTYLPLLDKYSEGTPDQKKIADLAHKTIDRFNEVINDKEKVNEEINLKIEITPTFQKYSNEKIKSLFNSKTLQTPPTQEEKDTLKMKAIRLIESEVGQGEGVVESLDAGEYSEISSDGKTITLMQTWSELPGEVHRIVGEFRRESRHSIPIKNSFKLYLESIQPGHPYPPQRMGWSLSHWLIPSSVIWLDQIPLLKPLSERKKLAGIDLLPGGKKNFQARRLFRLKKIIFESLKLEYLSFHQELVSSIMRSHPLADDAFHESLLEFFEYLSTLPNTFEWLSKTNDTLNKIYIDMPFQEIENLRLEPSSLFTSEKSDRLEKVEMLYLKARKKAEETLDPELPPQIKNYLNTFGKIIGDSAQKLLLMQISEKIHIKPPILSDFDLKLQAAAFKHLISFLEELDEDVDLANPKEKESLIAKLRAETRAEIELFEASSFEEIDPYLQELVDEIVSYYHARFHENFNE